MDYKNIIKGYRYWDLYLHENQCYLGRAFIMTKSPDLVDLLDAPLLHIRELYKIMRNYKKLITELFFPNLFNYASLGNRFPQLHAHIIPRYKEQRIFESTVFTDNRWGRNFSPYDMDYQIPEICFKSLHTLLCTRMNFVEDHDNSNS